MGWAGEHVALAALIAVGFSHRLCECFGSFFKKEPLAVS
jgi:hypothetical protein